MSCCSGPVSCPQRPPTPRTPRPSPPETTRTAPPATPCSRGLWPSAWPPSWLPLHPRPVSRAKVICCDQRTSTLVIVSTWVESPIPLSSPPYASTLWCVHGSHYEVSCIIDWSHCNALKVGNLELRRAPSPKIFVQRLFDTRRLVSETNRQALQDGVPGALLASISSTIGYLTQAWYKAACSEPQAHVQWRHQQPYTRGHCCHRRQTTYPQAHLIKRQGTTCHIYRTRGLVTSSRAMSARRLLCRGRLMSSYGRQRREKLGHGRQHGRPPRLQMEQHLRGRASRRAWANWPRQRRYSACCMVVSCCVATPGHSG